MINEDIMLNSGEALKAYITGFLDNGETVSPLKTEALKAYITGFLDFSNCHCGTLKEALKAYITGFLDFSNWNRSTLKEALKAYITGFLDAMKESLRDMTLEELQDTYHWLQGEKDNG